MAKPDPYGAYEDETKADDAMTKREKDSTLSRKEIKGQRKVEKEQLHKIEKQPHN